MKNPAFKLNDASQIGFSKRLLIIEDSIDFQYLLCQLFGSEGYHVDTAPNGAEALGLLRKSATLPNLILLDLMMPIMDGFEFRRLQLEDPRLNSIPVVVMTAHGDAKGGKMKIDAKEYLRKPSDMDTFLKTVHKYCV